MTRTDLREDFEYPDSLEHTRQFYLDMTGAFFIGIAIGAAICYLAFWFYDGFQVNPFIAVIQTFVILGLAGCAVSVFYWGYMIKKNRRGIKAHFLKVIRKIKNLTNFRE